MKRYRWEIVAGVIVLGAAIFNNRGFLGYAFQKDVIARLSPAALFSSFVVTPLLLLCFLALFFALGKRALALLAGNAGVGAYAAVFSLALGMGLYNLILSLFGALGLLYTSVTIALLLCGSAVAGYDAWNYFRKGPRITPCLPGSTEGRVGLLTVGVTLFQGFIKSVSPPVSWDSLAYHLPVPQLYNEAHRIYPVPWMIEKQCTIGMEMVTASALSLNNDLLAQLLLSAPWVVLLASVFIFAKKYLSAPVAWLGITLAAVLPVVLELWGTASNDFAAALFMVLAVIAAGEYLMSGERKWWGPAAAFAALSIQAKMTGLITASWIVLLMVTLLIMKRVRLTAKETLAPLLVFLLLGSFALIRNYVWTGNPLFPYFNNEVQTRVADNDRLLIGVGRNAVNALLLPYHLAVSPGRFQHDPRSFAVGVTLIFLLRAAQRRGYSRLERFLLCYAGYFLLVWFVSGKHLWRYLLPVLPWLALLAVQWWKETPWPVVKTVVGMALLANAVPLLTGDINNHLFAACSLPSLKEPSRTAQERYLELSLDHYDVYRYANRHLPEDAKILLFREIRGYYLTKSYLWGDPLNQGVIKYETFAREQDLRERLLSLGVTHVVINNNLFPPAEHYYRRDTVRLMDELLHACGTPVYTANGVMLYELR